MASIFTGTPPGVTSNKILQATHCPSRGMAEKSGGVISWEAGGNSFASSVAKAPASLAACRSAMGPL